MKTMKLFMAAALTVGFAACSNDDIVRQENGTAPKATVSIQVANPAQMVRGVVAADQADKEAKITKLEAFVFKGDVRVGYKAEAGTDVKKVEGISAETGAQKLIVVANAHEDLSGVMTKTALEAKLAEDVTAQDVANLSMTSAETDVLLKAGDNYYGYPDADVTVGNELSKDNPLKLTRMAACVVLNSVTTNFTGALANVKFVPEQVFVFNVPQKSKYFGTDLAVTTGNKLLSGFDISDTKFDGVLKPTGFAAADVKTQLLNAYQAGEKYTFYSFENKGMEKPLVLTVQGKLYKDTVDPANLIKGGDMADENGNTFYSVVVNGARTGYTYTPGHTADDAVKCNTKYTIDLTIKRFGSKIPTDITESATLNVNCTVTPWTEVTQTVEY